MTTPSQKLIADADSILSNKHHDLLLDWRDAAQMYLTAGEFGSGEAFAKLANMYRGIRDKKYFKKDYLKALTYFKKSVSLGYYECLPHLAGLYIDMDEPENFLKIWKLYFDKINNISDHKAVNYYFSICVKKDLIPYIDKRVILFREQILFSYKEWIKYETNYIMELQEELKNGNFSESIYKDEFGTNYIKESEAELARELKESREKRDIYNENYREARFILDQLGIQ